MCGFWNFEDSQAYCFPLLSVFVVTQLFGFWIYCRLPLYVKSCIAYAIASVSLMRFKSYVNTTVFMYSPQQQKNMYNTDNSLHLLLKIKATSKCMQFKMNNKSHTFLIQSLLSLLFTKSLALKQFVVSALVVSL